MDLRTTTSALGLKAELNTLMSGFSELRPLHPTPDRLFSVDRQPVPALLRVARPTTCLAMSDTSMDPCGGHFATVEV